MCNIFIGNDWHLKLSGWCMASGDHLWHPPDWNRQGGTRRRAGHCECSRSCPKKSFNPWWSRSWTLGLADKKWREMSRRWGWLAIDQPDITRFQDHPSFSKLFFDETSQLSDIIGTMEPAARWERQCPVGGLKPWNWGFQTQPATTDVKPIFGYPWKMSSTWQFEALGNVRRTWLCIDLIWLSQLQDRLHLTSTGLFGSWISADCFQSAPFGSVRKWGNPTLFKETLSRSMLRMLRILVLFPTQLGIGFEIHGAIDLLTALQAALPFDSSWQAKIETERPPRSEILQRRFRSSRWLRVEETTIDTFFSVYIYNYILYIIYIYMDNQIYMDNHYIYIYI
jgi:hypothetical protein